MDKLKRPSNGGNSLEANVASLVSELMNSRTSFHKMHLKITGLGSYAGHKALNELYDALPEHADELAEGFQGAAEKLLEYDEPSTRVLNSVQEAISYIRDLYSMISTLQSRLPYSEIVNELDTIKSTLNSIRYKLLFLK